MVCEILVVELVGIDSGGMDTGFDNGLFEVLWSIPGVLRWWMWMWLWCVEQMLKIEAW